MATLLNSKTLGSCNSSLFKTAHSKPIFLCVLLSLVRPTTLLFNWTFSGTYSLYIVAFQWIQSNFTPNYSIYYTLVRPQVRP